jgi:hypothetical protein
LPLDRILRAGPGATGYIGSATARGSNWTVMS